MKLMLSVFSSVIILLSGSKNFLILADYTVNRDYYEEICINKNKPEMQCHGKCQMQKKSEEDSSAVNFVRFSVDFYQNLPEIFTVDFQKFSFEEEKQIPVFKNISLPEMQFSFPNPPPVV